MSGEPVLHLFSSGLLSKWGFGDGDAPDAWLDYCDELGVDYLPEWHRILTALVRRYLLPVLEQDVTVREIETNHNPIRASTVDGAEVEYPHDDSIRLTPECVTVPMSEVLRLAREL
jgi:hypothetical protein